MVKLRLCCSQGGSAGSWTQFDVFFEDEENVLYDIEMQTVPKSNLPKRTRAEGFADGEAKGVAEGVAEGTLKILYDLVHNNVIPLSEGAARANMDETRFEEKMRKRFSKGD